MFVIIDRADGGAFDALCDTLNKSGIKSIIINSVEDANNYLNSHPLEGTNFLIHASIGQPRFVFEREGYGADIFQIVESIHEKNIFSRVTIFSVMYDYPIESTVTELKADGFVGNYMTLDKQEELARRGNVTPEELSERGKTVEDVSIGKRVEGGLRHFKFSRERETD